jgi:PAT family beta-lactamase induction signal transducer AmpG
MNRYLRVFTQKRMLSTLLLGFSGGLPLALTGGTLQAWLNDSKVDVATIGMFALVGLPYAMKFLWAPLMDLKPLPFLGLRRGWLAVTQVGLFAATVALAVTGPAAGMFLFSSLAIVLAFMSASQDIVIDAYRTEIIEDESELGAGASTYVTGYRLAMVVSGGVALIMADHLSWAKVYIAMAVINLIGLATVLLSPEPKIKRAKRTLNLRGSIVQPFLEFFQRTGAMEILIFIMVYKLSTLMATALTTKFLMDLGYSKTLIGSVTKVVGLIATIVGTLSGGALMAKFGLKKSLWIFGIAQASVGITFCVLSRVAGPGSDEVLLPLFHVTPKDFYLTIIIALDNFMMGLGTAALTGFMMNFCSRQFTATQYALLTSVMAVSRVILVAHAGTMVQHMGWDLFFLSTIPLAIPGLALLYRFDHWETNSGKATAKVPRFDLALMALFGVSLVALSSDPIFEALKMNTAGAWATWAGAIGVAVLVFVGLLRPYVNFGSVKLKTS